MSDIDRDNQIERLKRARIQVQIKNPFFSFMSLYLKFKEIKDGEMDCDTMAVDVKGNLYYNVKFMAKLSDGELQAVLVHEILHLVLLHLTRQGTRDGHLFNVATDLCINYIVRENAYSLPKDCLIPDEEGTWEYQEQGVKIKIDEINKKSAEEVYDELIKQIPPEKRGNGQGNADGNGKGKGKGNIGVEMAKKGFDKHIYEQGLTEKEKKEVEKEWLDKVHESMALAKMRGNLPKGMERLIGDLHKEKINWRSLLNNYITQQIPYNSCYSKPHRRSISVGTYVPHQLKEKIEIAVCIDLSGSIGKEEYTAFLSEIVGIARAYQERIDIHFYSHDTEGYYSGMVRNGNIEKIKNISLKGGGGTSHKAVMDMMNGKEFKMVVFFTDGYSDLDNITFEDYRYEKVFVIVQGNEEQLKGKRCKIIKMESLK